MYVVYKQISVLLAIIFLFGAVAKGADGSAQLQDNCDKHNECTLNLNVSDRQWRGLCNSPELSMFWTKGRDRYLVQCRGDGTSEDNRVWVIDEKAGFFGKLYFGRFFKKSIFDDEKNIVIPDKFRSHGLCGPVDSLKLRLSDFVLLEKRPANNDDNPYCYDVNYLIFRDGRFAVEINGVLPKPGDTGHAVHAVSSQDRLRLNHLLDAARR